MMLYNLQTFERVSVWPIGLEVRFNLKNLTKITASFFGVGFAPIAPGTWGSAAGALLAWLSGDWLIYWALGLSALGLRICRQAQVVFGTKDPKAFVLDEVCGMMLSVLWLPKNVSLYFWAFILFRIFDIWKPWPISKIQDSKYPTSIMWDDLVAGVFANLILQAAVRAV